MQSWLPRAMPDRCHCRYETTKAGDAVKALKASLKPQATACRDGRWQTIDAALLVPGDLVLLGSGSHVPADCRVGVTSSHLRSYPSRPCWWCPDEALSRCKRLVEEGALLMRTPPGLH
jgi:hypothetical protein